MADLNFFAVGAAIVVAFAISSAWYAIFGNQMTLLSGSEVAETGPPPPWKIVVELFRSAVVALAIAWGVSRFGLTGLPSALGLALVL